MKILVIGGGGREHAVVKAVKKNKNVEKIYVLPGNGGIAKDAECVPIKATDIDGIADFAVRSGVDYAIVTPDDPLCLGAVDRLTAAGIPCFGPDSRAAVIEGSKAFAKGLMKKYGIPTASFEVFTDAASAIDYVHRQKPPIVVKADGLALGKGVIIASTCEEAENAVRSMMEGDVFGKSGKTVVIEEFLEGPEVSVLSFTDGKTIVPMVSSMDHKRAFDGDEGPNTGGMGTIAPNPYYTPEVAKRCTEEIFLPTVKAMNAEGRTFRGCLYFGLMITADGPKVIEYNCRFGDPETQVVLPLLKSDLLEVMMSTTNGTLGETKVEFSDESACCVVMASDGYPKAYEKGYEIFMDAETEKSVYYAGVAEKDGKIVTSGGRVLGAVATAKTLGEAVKKAYGLVGKISFENAYYRKDIGAKALARLKK